MDELIGEFITETTEGLDLLDQELVNLEQNPNDAAILGNIFRIVHTIKGTCGFLGLPRLEKLAHASENVLGKIRDKELEATEDAITLVLTSLDQIKELVEYLSDNGEEPEGEDSGLIAQLNYYANNGKIMENEGAENSAGGEDAAKQDEEDNAEPEDKGDEHGDEGADDLSTHFKGDDDLQQLIEAKKAEGNASTPETTDQKPAEKVIAKAPPKPAEKAEAAPAKAKEGASTTNQSIRVNLDILENLMQMVSELVLTRNQLMQIVRTKEDRDFLAPLQNLSHITTELQEGIMQTRMQPIGSAWAKFPRLIRDLSHELSKKIILKMNGEETELDRQLLELIKDPLTHMVRNSCDHGLESTEDRIAAGKPEAGTVILSAYHEGGHIIVEIKDDGRGVNIPRVKEKIIKNNLATGAEVENMSEKQIAMFIFKAGFSTAEHITSVSGRGVGMDVVKTNIEKIGGTIDLNTTTGKGSQFIIKIPLTLAIVSVLIVESREQRFAIPQINVVELVRVAPDSEYVMESINDAPVLRLREKLLPLGVLENVLHIRSEPVDWKSREAFVVVCKVGGHEFGIVVEKVYDTEEIVVKPVANAIKNIPLYSGNTILGDGSVILILDPNGLARSVGDIELNDDHENDNAVSDAPTDKIVSLLLFRSGKGAPKAVPLELVSRLEEIDVSKIECSEGEPVVQYRDELMQLVSLYDDNDLPVEGSVDVIVFTYDNKTVGLVVNEIYDIVHEPFHIKLPSKDKRYLGSMIIHGKTTEVMDVAQVLSDVLDSSMQTQDKVNVEEARKYSLLLVEDSLFFRNLTVPFLAAAGYEISAVESAAGALDLLTQPDHGIDLIVTDIEMPGMDGFEFTTTLRQMPGFENIPMLAYTASLSNEVIRKGKESGLDECILKTDRPGLLQSVSRYLNTIKRAAA